MGKSAEVEVMDTDLAVEMADETIEESLVILFKKPYQFEGNEYTEVDLSELENLSATDMIAIERKVGRESAGINAMPEVTVKYAVEMAARATKLPVEFFLLLPPNEAMKIKNRVMGFLFG